MERKSNSKTKVRVKHGTEGPKFDPYSFTEIVIEYRGHTYLLHEGIGCWAHGKASQERPAQDAVKEKSE